MNSEPPNPPAQPPVGALMSEAQMALLRRAVVVMTGILVAGVALLIGRIIYLANRPNVQAAATLSASAAAEPKLQTDVRLALPQNAEIRHISLAGGRLAVHHAQAGAPESIVILDMATGAVISRLTIDRVK